jgi:hypothetical protein
MYENRMKCKAVKESKRLFYDAIYKSSVRVYLRRVASSLRMLRWVTVFGGVRPRCTVVRMKCKAAKLASVKIKCQQTFVLLHFPNQVTFGRIKPSVLRERTKSSPSPSPVWVHIFIVNDRCGRG